MHTYLISIYPHFHCLGGECPYSCCKGWQVAVDDETWEKYQAVQGAYGRGLRFHVYKMKGERYLRKLFDCCPYWNSDHCCQFQVNGETDLMPLICRVYPRDSIGCDVETEVTLELSCIAAARMFLDHPERLVFVPVEENAPVLWPLDNHENWFYYFLKADRERMLDHIWESGEELAACWQTLYAFVYKKHDLIVMEKFEEAERVVLSNREEDLGMYYLNREPTYAFFSIRTIDRMILNQIDYGNLRRRERAFYNLIHSYRKRFSSFYVEEADRFFDQKIREMMEAGYGGKYRSYFAYCIQQLYLRAYETYHVLKEFLFAVLYTQLLMMFDLVDYLDNGEKVADLDRQSEILMLCERGVRHNASLTWNLLQIMRKEFL